MYVLVTGGAGGIGGGVARSLAAAGHDVLGVDRDADGLSDLPDAVETAVVDLRDEAAIRGLLADRPLDAVVSCVGGYEIAAVEDTAAEAFRRQLETNLTAVHATVAAALPTLRERGGRVVVVGSMAGSVALPYHGAYSAAKAGLDGYADSLRREVAPRGVDVALVEPGPVPTGFNERAAAAGEGGSSEGPSDEGPSDEGPSDEGPYADVYREFEGYSPAATDVETVVERVVTATTAERPRTRYRVSRRARWLPRLARVLPDRLYDRLVRAGLPGGLLWRLLHR
ncbi:NAD(P)-dependent dehydrogenase (short-subunit alcohol dehydrogenase family) [Halorubrum trapanicum]|uniref:NAD(P)-dependent dehydrogenase (Short-subunit alcohol dehydrogenase family) n=1 Tax=Halorubrum trapanicum TaxID=29284 RepID=A0A8J7RE93_9EURY|nr:SDR family NAD(P)-dependent oxidoreductase [Halorubrum trapanicum]MBP1902518.1 NAD(P)-dependent dehydrogenase (short-subunit alcohol dehydrogenase family) [Halorubrum trapanicum]